MQIQTARIARQSDCADGVLAQQSLSGDQQAFEMLAHRYSTPLFNFIYHFLEDYDKACDILQQVLLQLYLSLANLNTDGPLKPWLFQVARNRCLDEDSAEKSPAQYLFLRTRIPQRRRRGAVPL